MHRIAMCICLLVGCAGAPNPDATAAVPTAATPTAPTAPVAEAPAQPGADSPPGDAWTAFGADMAAERPIIPASRLLADPASFVDQQVRVEGRVADVCQKMGCWMVVADGDESMRVTMKDHDFAVDKQGAGSDCQIDGTVIAKKLDPEEVAHFESESAEGAVIPEKSVEGDVVYEIVAVGVRMRPAS